MHSHLLPCRRMKRRTTVEIDEDLLVRAKRARGATTTRATVEEALRRAADVAEPEHTERAERQRRVRSSLGARLDTGVLASEEMWR